MEKIWIKKELYILNYEFLKFYAFSDFSLIFKLIFYGFYLFKIAKKLGVILVHKPRMLTWGADVGRRRRGPRDQRADATWL